MISEEKRVTHFFTISESCRRRKFKKLPAPKIVQKTVGAEKVLLVKSCRRRKVLAPKIVSAKKSFGAERFFGVEQFFSAVAFYGNFGAEAFFSAIGIP